MNPVRARWMVKTRGFKKYHRRLHGSADTSTLEESTPVSRVCGLMQRGIRTRIELPCKFFSNYMNINQIRLAINLFLAPLLFLILMMVTSSAMEHLESQTTLRSLVPLIQWGSFGLLVAALATLGRSIWKISQAMRGVGELCHSCGMPTRFVSPGRYSPHYRCMACGVNRRA